MKDYSKKKKRAAEIAMLIPKLLDRQMHYQEKCDKIDQLVCKTEREVVERSGKWRAAMEAPSEPFSPKDMRKFAKETLEIDVAKARQKLDALRADATRAYNKFEALQKATEKAIQASEKQPAASLGYHSFEQTWQAVKEFIILRKDLSRLEAFARKATPGWKDGRVVREVGQTIVMI